MKYTVEMGSVAMIYTSNFNKVWFRHFGIYRHTDRMEIA
jgi:hypothetical protein